MSATNCPKCSARVSVPEAADPNAWVRCRVCSAEYQLREALEFNPPELELIAEPAIPAQPRLPEWATVGALGASALGAAAVATGGHSTERAEFSTGEADTLPLNGPQPYNAPSTNGTRDWNLTSDSSLDEVSQHGNFNNAGDDVATFDDSLLLDDSGPDDKTAEFTGLGAAEGQLSLDHMGDADGSAGIGRVSAEASHIDAPHSGDAAAADPDDFFNFANVDSASSTDAETRAYEAAFDPDAPTFDTDAPSLADAPAQEEEFRLEDDQPSSDVGGAQYKPKGMSPAYAPSGMSATSAAALAGATAVAVKRKKTPKINPILSLVGLVGGGAVGLAAAYAILMWVFAKDPFALGPMLPGFIVPQALQGTKPPSLARGPDVPIDEGATDETPADPNNTDPNNTDPNNIDPSATNPNANDPNDVTNPAVPGDAMTADPNSTKDPAADPFANPTTDPFKPAVEPTTDPASTDPAAADPAGDPFNALNRKRDPAMSKEPLTNDPPSGTLPDPFAGKPDPFAPKADPATTTDAVKPTDALPDPFAPKTEPKTDPAPTTDPSAAATTEPKLDPADPFGGKPEPMVEPKTEPAAFVGPKYDKPVTEEDFQKALELVNSTAGEFKSAPQAELTRRKGAFYQSLTKLGEAVTFVPTDAEGGRPGHRPMVSENLLGRVIGDAAMADEIGRLANLWMGAPSRKTPGIVLGGKIESAKQIGKFFELTVTLAGTEPKTKPQSVVVVMAEKPEAAVEAGDSFVALGVIVDDPKSNLPGYVGEADRLIWASVGTSEKKLARE